jgi:CDGSH-type Zn-finger protein
VSFAVTATAMAFVRQAHLVPLGRSALSFVGPARFIHTSPAAAAKRWKNKSELPFSNELSNPVSVVYGGFEKAENGYIYDLKPFKVSVKKYHVYDWCGCGMAHSQPLCDMTCQNRYKKKMIKGGPVKYIAPEDKDVWFCNCKQTHNRPFCDGSHRTNEKVLDAKPDGKVPLWEPRQATKK